MYEGREMALQAHLASTAPQSARSIRAGLVSGQGSRARSITRPVLPVLSSRRLPRAPGWGKGRQSGSPVRSRCPPAPRSWRPASVSNRSRVGSAAMTGTAHNAPGRVPEPGNFQPAARSKGHAGHGSGGHGRSAGPSRGPPPQRPSRVSDRDPRGPPRLRNGMARVRPARLPCGRHCRHRPAGPACCDAPLRAPRLRPEERPDLGAFTLSSAPGRFPRPGRHHRRRACGSGGNPARGGGTWMAGRGAHGVGARGEGRPSYVSGSGPTGPTVPPGTAGRRPSWAQWAAWAGVRGWN
jgi:hypothetical protein